MLAYNHIRIYLLLNCSLQAYDRLIDCLRELQTQGNTVVIVEHDEATMRAADFLVDMGPQAGNAGGIP